MKKWLTLILTIPLILSSLSCNTSKEKKSGDVTITFWHSFVASTIPALNELVEMFETEYPGINIKAQYIPTGDALIQKLITAIQSQTAPDISWVHSHFLPDLVDANAIYQMDTFVHGENGFTESDYADIYPALLQYASLRGKLVSIPMEATNLALIYNNDMLKKAGFDTENPPADWAELREYARALTKDLDNDGRNDQIGFFLPVFPASGPLSGWMVWQWFPYLWQAGGYVISEDQTTVLYNSQAGVKALTLWKDIYNDLNLRTFTTDYDVAFASQRVAMAMDGPWNLPRFNRILQDLDWAFAPLPAGPVKQATVVGGEYLVIFKQTEYPDEAWTFIKWIIRPDIQAKWSMKSGYLPVRKAVREIPEFKDYLDQHPNFKVFVDQMEIAQVQRPIDYYGIQIIRHIAEAIESATLGNMDPGEALNAAAEKSNALLQQAISGKKR